MEKLQFRVLYREFLFRIVDLELLAPQGDISKLLGQFAALLLVVSLWLVLPVSFLASTRLAPVFHVIGAWTAVHFLISTTMLVVGLFAVLSWDSAFPGPPRRTRAFAFAAAGTDVVVGQSRGCCDGP